MGSIRSIVLRAVLFLGLAGFTAATTFISGDVFQSHGSTGRSLLQGKTGCPVSFEFLNYTIITSKCKGPQYPASACCSAFKDLACPYADYLNDGSNYCAESLFSYIHLYGQYPQGLFASECREGKLGLACPPMAAPSTNDYSSANMNQGVFVLATFVAGFVLSFLSS